MPFVVTCLFVACGAAIMIIIALLGALYGVAGQRNDAIDRAEHAEDEADALQADLNAALSRLSRKRKPLVTT